jgi:hypothetical protein
MGVKAWATTPVPHPFRLFRGRALVGAERIEPFEDEPAVVAKELVQPKHPQKEDRIIIIALDPLTLAPWTLHTGPFYQTATFVLRQC